MNPKNNEPLAGLRLECRAASSSLPGFKRSLRLLFLHDAQSIPVHRTYVGASYHMQ